MGAMFAWFRCPAIFASSMNMWMKSSSSAIVGRIRFTAMIFSNPSTPNDLAV